MMMIEKYRDEVKKFYEIQRDLGRLSLNLTYPTVSKLRNECLMLFNEGLSKSDLRILTSFLGRPLNAELHESAIRCCDADKFKSLYNFMKKDIKTSEKNFEMLAWLTDFRPRQYSSYVEHQRQEREGISTYPISERNEMALEVSRRMEQFKRENVLCDLPSGISQAPIDRRSINLNYSDTKRRGSQKSSRLSGRYFKADSLPMGNRFDEDLGYLDHTETVKRNKVANNFNDTCDKEQTPITLEYPSGVKITLASANLVLISKLIRL